MNKLLTSINIFICSIMVMCSCGPKQVNTVTGVDEMLQPYVDDYKVDKKRFLGTSSIRNMTIVFYSLQRPVVGQCTRYSTGTRVIQIDPVYWFFGTSETEKKILMHHELGHCDLNKGHITNVPAIMNPNVMNEYEYIMSPDYYLEQLFRK